MAYAAKILADSVNPVGDRLTTFEVTFPRVILAEFNTHRVFSRNSASSRAIPVEKMIQRVLDDPFIPIHWGKNQKGMQAVEELGSAEQQAAERDWLRARDAAVAHVRMLLKHDVHKQITNRLLEPFLWHTAIVSATEYENFFALRCHPAAMPEIQRIATMMSDMYRLHEPTKLDLMDWHIPLVTDEDRAEVVEGTSDPAGATPEDFHTRVTEKLRKISAGRCARVSYLTHDGRRDHMEDIALCERLVSMGHMSPLEHVAQCLPSSEYIGNFRGWRQYRKEFKDEAVFRGVK